MSVTAVVSARNKMAVAVPVAPFASQLSVTTQPAGAVVNTVFTTQPVFQVLDQFGQPFAQSGIGVAVALNSGTGILGGTLTVNTNASGVATFTNLQYDTAEAITLVATSAGLTSAVTASVTVTSSGFAAPDLLVENFGATTFVPGATLFGGGTFVGPYSHIRGSDTGGMNGKPALETYWTASSPPIGDFNAVTVRYATQSGGYYIRLRFRMTADMHRTGGSAVKFWRTLLNLGSHGASLFLDEAGTLGINPGEDVSQNLTYACGLFQAGAPSFFAPAGGITYSSNISDGLWHELEIFTDRNAAGNRAEVKAWWDGTPIIQPAGLAQAHFGGTWTGNWEGGDAGTDTPSTLYESRSNTLNTNEMYMNDTFSNNPASPAGSLFWDQVAVSTQRIGPSGLTPS